MLDNVRSRLRAALLKRLLRPPVDARHVEYSMVMSADDDPAKASPRLLRAATQAVAKAPEIDLSEVTARADSFSYFDVWPGEHYKLLAALVAVLQPKLVVEIGTAQGLSALTIEKFLPEGGKVVTFDIHPWRDIPGTVLTPADFERGRIRQELGDLSDDSVFARHRELLERADLLFVDAPKDGRFEPLFLSKLGEIRPTRPLFVLLDDIRLWNMLAVWRGIRRPKLDLTSFGHWSGTGIIDWAAA